MEQQDFDRRLGRQGAMRRRDGDSSPAPRQLPGDAASSNKVDDVFGRRGARQRDLERVEREAARLEAEERAGRGGGRRRGDDWDDLNRW